MYKTSTEKKWYFSQKPIEIGCVLSRQCQVCTRNYSCVLKWSDIKWERGSKHCRRHQRTITPRWRVKFEKVHVMFKNYKFHSIIGDMIYWGNYTFSDSKHCYASNQLLHRVNVLMYRGRIYRIHVVFRQVSLIFECCCHIKIAYGYRQNIC